MFMTKQQAEERLSSNQNVFRKKVAVFKAVAVLETDQIDETEIPNTVDVPEHAIIVPPSTIAQLERAAIRKEEAEMDAEEDEPLDRDPRTEISLAKLDALISPNAFKPGPKYMGNVPAQIAIGQTDILLGQSKASKLFGLSTSQTQAYGDALRSSSNYSDGTPPKPELKKALDQFRQELGMKAAKILGQSLDKLNGKVEDISSPLKLARLGKDMAAILEKVTTTKDVANDRGVNFHIYRPETNVENNYTTVQIGSATSEDEMKLAGSNRNV